MPPDVQKSLHPWLRQMVGNTPDGVRTIVEKRWSSISHDSLHALKTRLLEFTPRGIVVYEGEAWLVMERPLPLHKREGQARDITLLAPPPDAGAVTRGLDRFKFADSPLFREFVENFGSLRESIPNYAGDFRVPKEWESLYDYWGEDEGMGYGKWYTEWSNALVLYVSLSGDMLLLHPRGNIAWIYLEGGVPPRPIADDFEGFIRYYTDYRQQPRELDANH